MSVYWKNTSLVKARNLTSISNCLSSIQNDSVNWAPSLDWVKNWTHEKICFQRQKLLTTVVTEVKTLAACPIYIHGNSRTFSKCPCPWYLAGLIRHHVFNASIQSYQAVCTQSISPTNTCISTGQTERTEYSNRAYPPST